MPQVQARRQIAKRYTSDEAHVASRQTSTLYKPYSFLHPHATTLEEVTPLEEPPKILPHTIPRVDVLLDLTEGRSFAEAFLIWASDTLGLYEAAWAATADVDTLDEAVTQARQTWQMFGEAHEHFAARRQALQPFVDAKLSMRSIANMIQVPLADVVGTLLNPNCMPRAEQYAAMEEDILDGELQRTSQRALYLKHGFTNAFAVRSICKRHGLPWTVKAQTEAA